MLDIRCWILDAGRGRLGLIGGACGFLRRICGNGRRFWPFEKGGSIRDNFRHGKPLTEAGAEEDVVGLFDGAMAEFVEKKFLGFSRNSMEQLFKRSVHILFL